MQMRKITAQNYSSNVNSEGNSQSVSKNANSQKWHPEFL